MKQHKGQSNAINAYYGLVAQSTILLFSDLFSNMTQMTGPAEIGTAETKDKGVPT
jgi:hypothetical protein